MRRAIAAETFLDIRRPDEIVAKLESPRSTLKEWHILHLVALHHHSKDAHVAPFLLEEPQSTQLSGPEAPRVQQSMLVDHPSQLPTQPNTSHLLILVHLDTEHAFPCVYMPVIPCGIEGSRCEKARATLHAILARIIYLAQVKMTTITGF